MLGRQLAVLNVFHKVGQPSGGILCGFCGQSGTSPEQVRGEAQAGEEQGGAGRPAPISRGWEASGDLHLGNDEGRERDVGCQSGAVRVDEGLDFLCFLIAGLNLQGKDPFNRKSQNLETVQSSKFQAHVPGGMATEAACFPLPFLCSQSYSYRSYDTHRRPLMESRNSTSTTLVSQPFLVSHNTIHHTLPISLETVITVSQTVMGCFYFCSKVRMETGLERGS